MHFATFVFTAPRQTPARQAAPHSGGTRLPEATRAPRSSPGGVALTLVREDQRGGDRRICAQEASSLASCSGRNANVMACSGSHHGPRVTQAGSCFAAALRRRWRGWPRLWRLPLRQDRHTGQRWEREREITSLLFRFPALTLTWYGDRLVPSRGGSIGRLPGHLCVHRVRGSPALPSYVLPLQGERRDLLIYLKVRVTDRASAR